MALDYRGIESMEDQASKEGRDVCPSTKLRTPRNCGCAPGVADGCGAPPWAGDVPARVPGAPHLTDPEHALRAPVASRVRLGWGGSRMLVEGWPRTTVGALLPRVCLRISCHSARALPPAGCMLPTGAAGRGHMEGDHWCPFSLCDKNARSVPLAVGHVATDGCATLRHADHLRACGRPPLPLPLPPRVSIPSLASPPMALLLHTSPSPLRLRLFLLQVWNSHPKKFGPGSRQW